jgi:hypothetical protein
MRSQYKPPPAKRETVGLRIQEMTFSWSLLGGTGSGTEKTELELTNHWGFLRTTSEIVKLQGIQPWTGI